MDSLIIFGAKYLWIISVALALHALYKNENKREFIKIAALSLPLSLIVAKIANKIYENPRPFVVGGYEPLIHHAPDNGFPSDHTLLVAALAALVTVFNRKLGILLWIITIAVAVSRVLAGVHHTLDVLGSIIISSLVILMIYFWDKRKKHATHNTPSTIDSSSSE